MTANQDNEPLIDKSFKVVPTLPGPLHIERGIIDSLESILDEIGSFSNVLVIAEPVTYDLAGNTIRSSLKGSKCTFYMISNASVEEVKKAESVLMKSNSDIVLGLGVDNIQDSAKIR